MHSLILARERPVCGATGPPRIGLRIMAMRHRWRLATVRPRDRAASQFRKTNYQRRNRRRTCTAQSGSSSVPAPSLASVAMRCAECTTYFRAQLSAKLLRDGARIKSKQADSGAEQSAPFSLPPVYPGLFDDPTAEHLAASLQTQPASTLVRGPPARHPSMALEHRRGRTEHSACIAGGIGGVPPVRWHY